MKLIKSNLNGMDFWYREDDRYVGQRVAVGKYEEYETKLLLSQIKPDSVVVDVGANIGYYTLLMAKIAKKVYAFEPEKETFEILKKNVETNNLKNVVLINAAVGDKTEKRQLIIDKDNYGNSRLNPSKSPFNKGDFANCFRLDDVIKENISLIKIDVQGWEPAVIEGAKNILERDSPTLFLEYWPKGFTEAKLDGERMMKFLKSIYKNIWQIDTELNIYKKIGEKIIVDNKTGYVDVWMKKDTGIIDKINSIKDLRIKNFVKNIWKR